jgi:hypothetical protein
MDRTPQVEPLPAPSDLLAADKPRAHDACKSLGERMRLCHVHIGDVTEIGARQVFRARCALAAGTAIGCALAVTLVATLDMIWLTSQTVQ